MTANVSAARGRKLARPRLARADRALVVVARRIDNGLAATDLKADAIADLMDDMPSGFGPLRAVRHAAQMSQTPARWDRPAVPLGSQPPQWP